VKASSIVPFLIAVLTGPDPLNFDESHGWVMPRAMKGFAHSGSGSSSMPIPLMSLSFCILYLQALPTSVDGRVRLTPFVVNALDNPHKNGLFVSA